MKLAVQAWRGEAPIMADRLLPEGLASAAVNANLVGGDLAAFQDLANPYALAKPAPINTLWLMQGPSPDYWLHFAQGEVGYGSGVDISLGTIPGDASLRSFLTGLSGGPKQTNLHYATDPSQQGGKAAGAYPYTLFPLGIESPGTKPAVVGPGAPGGPTTSYNFAAEASVNSATVAAPGTGYRVGDVLQVQGGTVAPGLNGASLTVTAVDQVTQGVTGVGLQLSGYYMAGAGPTVPAPASGGHGSGATFDLNVVGNRFDGFDTYTVDNGAGYYIHWNIGGSQWAVQSGQGDLTVAYSTQTFGLKTAASWVFQADMQTDDNGGAEFTDLVMYLCGTYSGTNRITGPGLVLSKSDGRLSLFSDFNGSNGGAVTGTVVAQAPVSVAGNTLYRLRAACAAQSASTTPGFTVSVSLWAQADLTTPLVTLSGFVPYVGESIGVGSNHRGNGNHGNDAQFENLLVQVTAQANQATAESTSYVYTYVTYYGIEPDRIEQESGPSDPSDTVTFYLDGSTPPVMTPVTVTINPAPAGLAVDHYNLYRLVAQADGTEVYEYVDVVPAQPGNSVYTDSKLDADLGDPLPSADWAPPPPDLQGILALPNGIMAGFFANTLCLSAQNFPFAWPVGNQLPTDTPIVAIAAIDTTVLILTTAHPYTAWGSEPAAYSMSKETANQGCVAKRSAATHKQMGVVYASGNGLCYYRGQGQLDLIRMPNGSPYFSIEQWQALNPSSILGVVHDDRYWFWYDNGVKKGGYVLDLSPAGFGLVELDFHVTAAFVDAASDRLYVVPDASLYPVNGGVVSAALNVVSEWGAGSGMRPRSWQREDLLLPRPACFTLARVRAADYADVRLKVWNEHGVACDRQIADGKPFVLAPQVGVRWNLAVSGASTVNSVELVEQAEEFLQ